MLDCGIIFLLKQIVIHMVYNVCLRLNAFLLKLGLSIDYSPWELVTHRSVTYKIDCKSGFGSYDEDSTDAMVTNRKISRRHNCIVVGTSGNRQGLLKCFDLTTGSVVTRRIFDVLPMPDRIVKQVNSWGVKSKKEIRKI